LREHIGERIDVGRQARDDPARFLLREVAERERGQVVEEILAQPEHHVLADARETADERRLHDPREPVDREIDEDVDPEPRLVVRAHAVVDRVLHDQERGHRRRGRADAEQGKQDDALTAADQIAPKTGKAGALLTRQR
jgi:hypothetical protein